MDQEEPPRLRPLRLALSERSDGRRVGAGGAVDTAGQARRASAEVNLREVLNGIFYVLSTGCQWRALPKDLPPKSTVHDYLTLWDWDGTLLHIHHTLYMELRECEGREASPTVAIIDSQSVKGAEKGGRRSIRRAMTPARRSRARSAISSSTRSACC